MADTFVYVAYGLRIRADFELWPWGNRAGVSEPGQGEVSVRLSTQQDAFPVLDFRPGRAEAVLEWPGVGEFWIAHGDRIIVRPASGVSTEELALVTAGSALALLLEQRGHAVLHGSCVEVRGEAIALLGPSGVGKSTIAATLRDGGCGLISDGMTVLNLSGKVPLALPGPAHLKLWPDAIESLHETTAASRPVVRQEAKRWYEATSGTVQRPIPIRRIFLLHAGTPVQTSQLSPAAGLIGLVKNYFLADFADAAAREFILNRCAPVAQSVPVSTMQRGRALGDLANVIAQLSA